MSRAWILDVLDRELPDMVGAERDRIADAILDALPVRLIAGAIGEAATTQLRAWGVTSADERATIGKDIGGNAAMSVLGVLGDDDDEQLAEERPHQ